MKAIGWGLILLMMVGNIGCGDKTETQIYGKYNRANLRYYAYAPPFIPHEALNPECLDCHQEGLVVEGRRAVVTPHPELLNCVQCHIRPKEGVKHFRRNLFVGLQEPKRLPRPQPAGPPLIPHRVFMRQNCLVCHGVPRRKEITRTTHPERWNCLQCHLEQDAQVELFKNNTRVADAY